MASQAEGRKLANTLGFIDSEELDELLESHPTIKAYLDGEITFVQAMFVEEFLSNGFDIRRAAEAARFHACTAKAYDHLGYRVMAKPKIRRLIARRIAERAITADEVVARFKEVADATMEDFVSVHEVEDLASGLPIHVAKPDLKKAEERGKLRFVKQLTYDKEGKVTIKLRDQDKALEQLARHLGVFEADNLQRIPPDVAALLSLSPEERKARMKTYKDMLTSWEDDEGETVEG